MKLTTAERQVQKAIARHMRGLGYTVVILPDGRAEIVSGLVRGPAAAQLLTRGKAPHKGRRKVKSGRP